MSLVRFSLVLFAGGLLAGAPAFAQSAATDTAAQAAMPSTKQKAVGAPGSVTPPQYGTAAQANKQAAQSLAHSAGPANAGTVTKQ